MMFSIILLVSPAVYPGMVRVHRTDQRFLRYVTRAAEATVISFGLALGLDFYVGGWGVSGPLVAALLGTFGVLVCAYAWFGMVLLERRKRSRRNFSRDDLMKKIGR